MPEAPLQAPPGEQQSDALLPASPAAAPAIPVAPPSASDTTRPSAVPSAADALPSMEDALSRPSGTRESRPAADQKADAPKADQPKDAPQPQPKADDLDPEIQKAIDKLGGVPPQVLAKLFKERSDHPLAKYSQGEASRMVQHYARQTEDANARRQQLEAQSAQERQALQRQRELVAKANQTDDWAAREAAREELLGPLFVENERLAVLQDPQFQAEYQAAVQQAVQANLQPYATQAFTDAVESARAHDAWKELPAEAFSAASAREDGAAGYYDELFKARVKAEGLLTPKEAEKLAESRVQDDRATGYSQLFGHDTTPSQGMPSHARPVDWSKSGSEMLEDALSRPRQTARANGR